MAAFTTLDQHCEAFARILDSWFALVQYSAVNSLCTVWNTVAGNEMVGAFCQQGLFYNRFPSENQRIPQKPANVGRQTGILDVPQL